jgi:cytochrome c biogenesis protein CcmG/thiol:disulfide interchange protein DsbE
LQFLEKIKKSIFSLIILILLIISFFIFKFALQKEKIYTPKMTDNQIFTDFKVQFLIDEKQINFNKVLTGKNFYLINIWSSWCEPCKDESEHLLELKNDTPIMMIGINYKDKKKNALNFLKLYGDPFEQIFVDKQGLISINFGAYGVPETFLINNDNKVLKKYIGPLNDEDVYEIKKITKN